MTQRLIRLAADVLTVAALAAISAIAGDTPAAPAITAADQQSFDKWKTELVENQAEVVAAGRPVLAEAWREQFRCRQRQRHCFRQRTWSRGMVHPAGQRCKRKTCAWCAVHSGGKDNHGRENGTRYFQECHHRGDGQLAFPPDCAGRAGGNSVERSR